MKKHTLNILFSLIISSSLFAQLNPINNLNWNHWYECPHNYFRLTWDTPNASNDTLIGYNIYRENELFRFQIGTILNCESGGAGNCTDNFLFFEGYESFWIHVTAVYNSTETESLYTDSVFCTGYAINSVNIENQKIKIFPNPTTGLIKIDNSTNIKQILIMNQSGQILQNKKNETFQNLSHLPKGIYFVKVTTEQGSYTEKIILE
jgi:hypothetical protein